jgi:hypothetical protein
MQLSFDEWCGSVRDRFEKTFGYTAPRSPSLVELDSRVQERIMRCGVEAHRFGLEHYDEMAVLAHHTLILEDVKAGMSNSHMRYVAP